MNTPPIHFTQANAANWANQAPPTREGGPQRQGESYIPGAEPIHLQAPVVPTGEPQRKVSKGWLLAGAGALALAVGLVMTGPLGPSAQEGAKPPGHTITVTQPGKTCLTSELTQGSGLEKVCLNGDLTTRSFGESREYVEIRPDSGSHSLNGHTLTYKGSTLYGSGGTEEVPLFSPDTDDLVHAFNSGEATSDWSMTYTVRPAGGVATMASVAVNGTVESGGASPNQEAYLATFDHVSGERVYLQTLLGPEKFDQVVKDIQTELGKRPAGTLFDHGGDLASIVNQSFAVHDDGGQLKITVAVPGATEANEGKVAEFTFSVPRDILK